jgi:hypothetical protein
VSSRPLVASAVVAVLAAAPASPAQDAAAAGGTARPWRVLGGASLAGGAFETSYVSRYAPPLPGVPHESSAIQTLPLDAKTGHGLQIGVERTLGTHLALQLLGEYAESDIAGEPGRYDVRMVYTSRPPPSNDPVAAEVRRSEARPEAAGRMKTWVVAANLSAFLDAGSKARVGFSAGPAWLRSEGVAESLVYTAYTLGGHSVLFSEDHLVSFEFPSSGVGLDVGAFVEADLGTNVGLRLDARYFWGPERDADVTLAAVVNASDVVRSVELAEIQPALAPPPVHVDPSLARAALSLVIHF